MSEMHSDDRVSASQADPNKEFHIVGVGASAGGLEAFEQLFQFLPPDTDMAFVLVQHLSPPHKSILPELIQRYTAMPVFQVTDGVEVQPNCVYVIPPGTDLALESGHLALLEPEAARGYRLPIDFFFHSLAQDQRERAIGIVLSGTGSDGSQGLKSIKAEGGMTIAQEPESAAFGDMPRNAIATRDIDFILPPEKMGELIVKYSQHQVIEGYKGGENDSSVPIGSMEKLYYLLRSKTGHDFSLYKQSTIRRRIERRIKIKLLKSLDDYLALLQEHPEEVEALFRELLINVTHFFRDSNAFEALTEKVIRSLLPVKASAGTPLRVWIAGCSTGEEAYSIAIAIQEQIEALRIDCKVQIYATDIDEEAIIAARTGIYSTGISADVSAERLQRFFHQEDEVYQVKKNIRDMVVFATQNVIHDPPFSRIDLLCCRNLLIYLEPELQSQLFPLFHYALNPEGILFLGNSESVGTSNDLFTVVDRKYKLYRRREGGTQRRFGPGMKFIPTKAVPIPPEKVSNLTQPEAGGLREWTEKILLEYHTPACVIIDSKHDILYIHGRSGKYLEPAPGEANANLLQMAREGLKTELTNAIHQAAAHHETVRRFGVQVKTNGDFQPVDLTVRPIDSSPNNRGLIMVVFEEGQVTQPGAPHGTPVRKRNDRRIDQLEQELREKDEYLKAIVDEMEGFNQDLKSTNEELQSSNEEMQSANEEMETSREELQSVNEELSTINTELQKKNEELAWVNNDMFNLLASTEIGTIFLDLDLKIRRFTPTVNRIYNFLPGDVGRPLSHFVSNLNDDSLIEDGKKVLKTLIPKAVEVMAKDNTWYLVNINPYRTLENVIDGIVITFVDITEQKRGDELRRMGTILRDSNDAVTMQDFNGKILAWNRGAVQLYGWSEEEALKMTLFDMIPESEQAETASLYHRLSRGEVIRSSETKRTTRDGRTLDVWLTITALVNDASQPVGITTTERDITDRKRAEQRLFLSKRALKAVDQWYKILVKGDEPVSLMEAACQILAADNGYRLAWVGRFTGEKTKSITPEACFGLKEGKAGASKTGWAFSTRSQKAVESALRSGLPLVVRHIPTDPAQEPWRSDAMKHNYGSFIVLPLMDGENPLGVLVIYALEPEAFEESELELLRTLSESISRVLAPTWKPQATME